MANKNTVRVFILKTLVDKGKNKLLILICTKIGKM
jgi:hypothetical protein